MRSRLHCCHVQFESRTMACVNVGLKPGSKVYITIQIFIDHYPVVVRFWFCRHFCSLRDELLIYMPLHWWNNMEKKNISLTTFIIGEVKKIECCKAYELYKVATSSFHFCNHRKQIVDTEGDSPWCSKERPEFSWWHFSLTAMYLIHNFLINIFRYADYYNWRWGCFSQLCIPYVSAAEKDKEVMNKVVGQESLKMMQRSKL